MTIPTFPASGAGFPSVEANIPSFPTSVAALNPYWPFPDIALPPFLWRPDLTGDYRNVGSAGAVLDLLPVTVDNPLNPTGSPPPQGTFNNGWVIHAPTGESSVINIPYHADVSNLGNIWSFIAKFKVVSTYL